MVDPNKARLKSCKDAVVVSTARKYVAKAKDFRNFCLKWSRLPRGAKSVIKKWTPKQGDMSYHIPKQAMKDGLTAEWHADDWEYISNCFMSSLKQNDEYKGFYTKFKEMYGEICDSD